MLAVFVSNFSHQGVFSFSSVSSMRIGVSSTFPKAPTISYILSRESFNHFYLPFFFDEGLFFYKNNLAVFVVNFWFPGTLIFHLFLLPLSFPNSLHPFLISVKKYTNVPPSKTDKYHSHHFSYSLNVQFYLYSSFYQYLY